MITPEWHTKQRNSDDESHPPRASPPSSDPWPLDKELLYFSDHPDDVWTIRDSLEGIQIFGAPGSGKTSGSGAAIAKALLRAGYGMVIGCVKTEEYPEVWKPLCEATGRSGDVIRFAPDEPWRFNFLDYELRRSDGGGGQTENLVVLMDKITAIISGGNQQREQPDFWQHAMKELLRNAIDVLSLSQGTLSLQDILTLVSTAPTSPDQIADKEWRRNVSFCCQKLAQAGARKNEVTAREQHDLEMCLNYFLRLWPNLADRTRSGVLQTLTSLADTLLHAGLLSSRKKGKGGIM